MRTFATLGVQPLIGRFYDPPKTNPARSLTAVVSEPFWRRELGGDPARARTHVAIGKRRYEIVGVTPDGFTGADLSAIDVWLPLRGGNGRRVGASALETRTWWWTNAVIR